VVVALVENRVPIMVLLAHRVAAMVELGEREESPEG
jgi:hypothetical protein